MTASRDYAARALLRSAAIDNYQILDTPPELHFDDIAALAATICGTPFAAIAFATDARAWAKAVIGLDVRETPLSQTFAVHVLRQSGVFIVTDALHHPLFAEHPVVVGENHVRFYAGMPLFAGDGTPIAVLAVLDRTPRPGGLTAVQEGSLHMLARQVETQLEMRRSIIERDQRVVEQYAMAEHLRWIAGHDTLTELPNRMLFQARLDAALEQSRLNHSRTAMLRIDIDHFKGINDSFGHDAGDALLRVCAERLTSLVRASDTVARIDGDEFAIVLPAVAGGDTVDRLVRSLSDRLRQPLRHDGRLVECRINIGVAVFPDDASTADDLTRCADLALTAAKAEGRGSAVNFKQEMAAELKHHKKMLALARTAIDHDQITPYYQPKIDLNSGAIVGFEALLRWRPPGGALELPSSIAGAFSDRELSLAISERILKLVLRDMRGWLDAGLWFGDVAINACSADFYGDGFADRLLARIEASGVSPSMIQIEVTESVFLGNTSHYVQNALAKLSHHGVRIALDDFGTGFASLTHLKQFPIDVLKIDRSFVAGVGTSIDDAAIVRAVITLGASLGIEIVAEGIETSEQADYVRSNGCTLGQGFLYGAACPADEIPGLVLDWGGRRDTSSRGDRVQIAL